MCLAEELFALQRVSICVSLCSISSTKATRRRTKIGVKIDVKKRCKIAPESTSGRPKRPRDSQGRSGASPMHSGSAPQRPGSARRVPKSVPVKKTGAFTECPGAPGSAPRQLISTLIRRRDRKNRVFVAHLGRAGPSEQCFDDVCRFSVFSPNEKSLFRTTPVSKNKGSALRAASRVARATQPRKTTKIGPKIDLRSSKIASRVRSGTLFGRL